MSRIVKINIFILLLLLTVVSLATLYYAIFDPSEGIKVAKASIPPSVPSLEKNSSAEETNRPVKRPVSTAARRIRLLIRTEKSSRVLIPTSVLNRFCVGHHFIQHKVNRTESSHGANNLQSCHNASNP